MGEPIHRQETVREHQFTFRDRTALNRDFLVPRGDFAIWLGFKPMTEEEAKRQKKISGSRVVELALRKAYQELSVGGRIRGMEYIDTFIILLEQEYMPGHTREVHEAGLFSAAKTIDTLGSSLERSGAVTGSGALGHYFQMLEAYNKTAHEDSARYIEMQLRWIHVGRSFDTISNIMQVRHRAMMQAINKES